MSGEANEEPLARIAGDIASILELLETDPERYAAPSRVTPAMIEASLAHELRARDLRHAMMPRSVQKDGAWSIYLTIYRYENLRQPLSVTGAMEIAGVPQSTSLRWLHEMEKQRVLVRTPDKFDARRFWLTLSNKGRLAAVRYFIALRSGGGAHRARLIREPAMVARSAR